VETDGAQRQLFPHDDECFTAMTIGSGFKITMLAPAKDSVHVNDDSLGLQELLEQGAIPALDEGLLERIIVRIYDDSPQRLASPTTLESYALQFHYNVDNRATQLSVHCGQSDVKAFYLGGYTRAEVEQSLIHMVQQIEHLATSLPPLPASHWTDMSLVFNSTVPSTYQPYGFRQPDVNDFQMFIRDVTQGSLIDQAAQARLIDSFQAWSPRVQPAANAASAPGLSELASGQDDEALSMGPGVQTSPRVANIVLGPAVGSYVAPASAAVAPAAASTASAMTMDIDKF